jgi:hypothetical protein
MQELMDHFEVSTSEEGTEVRMRRRLARTGTGTGTETERAV